VRPPAFTTLEETDRIHTQPGSLGQVLLGQTCRVPVLTQQIPKDQTFTGVHYSLSLTSMLRDAS